MFRGREKHDYSSPTACLPSRGKSSDSAAENTASSKTAPLSSPQRKWESLWNFTRRRFARRCLPFLNLQEFENCRATCLDW